MKDNKRKWSKSEVGLIFGSAVAAIIFVGIGLKSNVQHKSNVQQTRSETLSGHKRAVISLSVSSDGKTLASGSKDETICLWDIQTRTSLRTLTGHVPVSGNHECFVNSVDFSPNNKFLASASEDGTIKLWDLSNGALLHSLDHLVRVNSALFSASSKAIVSQSVNGSINLWDATTGASRWVLSDAFRSYVGFSADSKTLILLDKTGTFKKCKIQEWSIKTHKLSRTQEIDRTDEAILAPDRKTLACIGQRDGKLWLQLMDFKTGKIKWTRQTEEKAINLTQNAVAFSPTGKMLAVVSSDGIISVWDVPSGKLKKTFKGLNCVVFASDEKSIITGSGEDGAITIWKLQ